MPIRTIIDHVVPERKENGQVLTTGQISEVLIANRLHHLRPLRDLSLNVEKESGVPSTTDIFKGNRADVSIVVENLKKLRRTLSYFEKRRPFIYR